MQKRFRRTNIKEQSCFLSPRCFNKNTWLAGAWPSVGEWQESKDKWKCGEPILQLQGRRFSVGKCSMVRPAVSQLLMGAVSGELGWGVPRPAEWWVTGRVCSSSCAQGVSLGSCPRTCVSALKKLHLSAENALSYVSILLTQVRLKW